MYKSCIYLEKALNGPFLIALAIDEGELFANRAADASEGKSHLSSVRMFFITTAIECAG